MDLYKLKRRISWHEGRLLKLKSLLELSPDNDFLLDQVYTEEQILNAYKLRFKLEYENFSPGDMILPKKVSQL